MKLLVASGKGGTGKTSVAVSLALTLAREGDVILADCDVEAPNCHLYVPVKLGPAEAITVPEPVVDPELCIGCGVCARACRFNAIVAVGGRPRVFPELCHGCGHCALVCPSGAISERPRAIGELRRGRSDALALVEGRLNVGEIQAVPVISATRAAAGDGLIIIDGPPGASCSLIASARDTDLVLLVTEPTPFGLHDLDIAVEALRPLNMPLAVVLNKASGDNGVARERIARPGLPLWAEIPERREFAEAYAHGVPLAETGDTMAALFHDLAVRIVTEMGV